MPGLSAVFSHDLLSSAKVDQSYKALLHLEKYSVKYSKIDRAVVGFSCYPGYPILQYEDKNVSILFEGLIYNQSESDVNAMLLAVANDFCSGSDYKPTLKKLIENADGDYIAVICDKNHDKLLIFNDSYGRLPSFFFSDEHIFAFSREPKFLLHWIPTIELDKIAMAEFLIYQYNLGEKTLIKGIKRFNPASVLGLKLKDDIVCLNYECLCPANFDISSSNLSIEKKLDRCVELYESSLSTRVERVQKHGLNIVTDLSGGHDSRVVFGAMCKSKVSFSACTDDLVSGSESQIASQLATIYNKPLCCSSANHPVNDYNTLKHITYMTDSTVNCWTAVSCYYDSLAREKIFQEPVAHFMGFGGEFIRHPYRLKTGYKNLFEMVKDAAYSNSIPVSYALAITNLSAEDFYKNIAKEISHFSEQTAEGQVKHLYFEYYNKMVNGGEDRHRLFAWTVQPLWGKFLYSFEISNIALKEISFNFFLKFLEQIDEKLLLVPIYGSRLRLDSKIQSMIYRNKMQLREEVSRNRHILHFYKKIKRTSFHTPENQTLITELCRETDLSFALNLEAIREFIASKPRPFEIYHLFTLMVYIAELKSKFANKFQETSLLP